MTRPTPVVTGAAVFGICGLLGSAESGGLPDARFDLGTCVDPDGHLDADRARRLDRAARLATVAVEHALEDAGASRDGTGLVLGSAFGNVDGSAAFMHRIFAKGPRAASPADFPNLVPSSPAGHVSIYLGLKGPTFVTADLATSGESAFAQASALVAAGELGRVVAAAVEPKSSIVDRVLSALFAHAASQADAIRTDVAAAVVIESEHEAAERGARVLARVRQVIEWRSDTAAAALASLEAPRGGPAEVFLPRTNGGAEKLLAATAWSGAARATCAPAVGENDALGAVAVAVAVGRIASGSVGEALVLGLAKGRGYAIILASR